MRVLGSVHCCFCIMVDTVFVSYGRIGFFCPTPHLANRFCDGCPRFEWGRIRILLFYRNIFLLSWASGHECRRKYRHQTEVKSQKTRFFCPAIGWYHRHHFYRCIRVFRRIHRRFSNSNTSRSVLPRPKALWFQKSHFNFSFILPNCCTNNIYQLWL